MRLYLDDDSASALLTRLLQQAGHDVETPSGAGLSGRADAIHLTWAIRENRVLLSRNYEDFEELHLLIQQAQGQHPGILVVRQDNDPRRDLTPRGIVRALGNLEAAGVQVQNDYLILNHWR
jgi:predicted nuclease of predicted toxin-antitoxin system